MLTPRRSVLSATIECAMMLLGPCRLVPNAPLTFQQTMTSLATNTSLLFGYTCNTGTNDTTKDCASGWSMASCTTAAKYMCKYPLSSFTCKPPPVPPPAPPSPPSKLPACSHC